MSIKKSSLLLLSAISLAAMLNGCGSSSKESAGSPADVAKVDEKTCAQCHGSSFNSQSGMPIYSEYVQSKHFINSIGEVVGCQDCHGGGAQHNGVGPIPFPNPDAAGKCFGCHKSEFLGLFNANKTPTAIQKAHFYNITGAGVHDAMYVTKNFENGCTACHEPHNPLKGKGAAERKAWAESGHGRVSNLPFADEDFKENTACIRCHTSTGYVNFLTGKTGGTTGAWSDPFPTKTWATPGDNGREVLTCRTCHNNDSFSVRGTTAFTIPYNSGKSPKVLPNVSKSNLCVACHSGRENEDTIEAIPDFTNVSFKNSHYKAGAALMYLSAGFRNFTSQATKVGTSTYAKTLNPDNISVPTYGIAGGVTSTHRKLGTTAINGDSHNLAVFVPGSFDDNGPCVTCHLNANGAPTGNDPATGRRPATGHSWKIDVNAVAQVCINCHASETADISGPVPVANQAALDLFLEEQSKASTDSLEVIKSLMLSKYGIAYNGDVYPYFYDMTKDPTGKTAVKDWTRGTKNQTFGKRMMGAAFNLQLITKDPGAYAHARTYVRRLIYDTIDWLDDGSMNFSSGATAKVAFPSLFIQDAQAYNTIPSGTSTTISTLFGTTTADMVYLLGFSRTTGAWNIPERP